MSKWLWVMGLMVLLPAAGCGHAEPEPAVSVMGKVSYRGRPLSQGTIVFTPDPTRGTEGPPLRTEVQADGAYQLKNPEGGNIAAGWYRVTVAAVEMGPAEPGSPLLVPHSLLPEKYRDPEQSGLTCEIKAGKANTIHFNLE